MYSGQREDQADKQNDPGFFMSGENGNKSCDNGGDQEKHADEAGQGSGGGRK